MCGTSSPSDKLTGDFGNEPDATSISDRGLFRLLAGNLSPGVFRLLQHNRWKSGHAADIIPMTELLAQSVDPTQPRGRFGATLIPLNDEASVRGLHQGQQSVWAASTGTHDCNRPQCGTRCQLRARAAAMEMNCTACTRSSRAANRLDYKAVCTRSLDAVPLFAEFAQYERGVSERTIVFAGVTAYRCGETTTSISAGTDSHWTGFAPSPS